MKHIYANLLGNWVDLSSDEECTIGDSHVKPNTWYEENAEIFAPLQRTAKNSLYQFPYVHIYYKGKDYRINPVVHMQIVTEPN